MTVLVWFNRHNCRSPSCNSLNFGPLGANIFEGDIYKENELIPEERDASEDDEDEDEVDADDGGHEQSLVLDSTEFCLDFRAETFDILILPGELRVQEEQDRHCCC